ncbi:MFS transporter [Ktedonosporobacter rubrisoli]|uniref:MFS transporter n=1 Tax=Ktedonosporobacter rubrisoli TaxID=2509675 RepID=A0A4P6K1C3_KTERU|nr:MFS transporter [Ktedonosporobacter rubrisoli]QBD81622.1 MFS transporter [Ktedonosporobacter rubrisoli]
MLHTLLNPFRQQTPVNKRRSGLATLTLLCAAQFMIVVDITIVNIALPSIQASLDFTTEADLQNVISLYALTFGGFLILAGRLADLWGRRRLFIAGLLVFACASLLCGFAPTALVLLIGRALQGCGSAMVSPAALSLLTTLFSEGKSATERLVSGELWGLPVAPLA